MRRKFITVAYCLGICAHLYDLLLHAQPHDHGRVWDVTMHLGWVLILALGLLDDRKATP